RSVLAGVNQVYGDPQLLHLAADAAGQNVSHAELRRDLPGVGVPVAVRQGGVSRNDQQGSIVRQGPDDVLADAFAEVLFGGIAAEVLERHDGDGGPVVPAQVRLDETTRRAGAALLLEPIDSPGSADVLEPALAEVGQPDPELVP